MDPRILALFLCQPHNGGLVVVEYDEEIVRQAAHQIGEKGNNRDAETNWHKAVLTTGTWQSFLLYKNELGSQVDIQSIGTRAGMRRKQLATLLVNTLKSKMPELDVRRMRAIVNQNSNADVKNFFHSCMTCVTHEHPCGMIFEYKN